MSNKRKIVKDKTSKEVLPLLMSQLKLGTRQATMLANALDACCCPNGICNADTVIDTDTFVTLAETATHYVFTSADGVTTLSIPKDVDVKESVVAGNNVTVTSAVDVLGNTTYTVNGCCSSYNPTTNTLTIANIDGTSVSYVLNSGSVVDNTDNSVNVIATTVGTVTTYTLSVPPSTDVNNLIKVGTDGKHLVECTDIQACIDFPETIVDNTDDSVDVTSAVVGDVTTYIVSVPPSTDANNLVKVGSDGKHFVDCDDIQNCIVFPISIVDNIDDSVDITTNVTGSTTTYTLSVPPSSDVDNLITIGADGKHKITCTEIQACVNFPGTVPPITNITNWLNTDTEIEFTDTHGISGTTPCTTWTGQTIEFSIDNGLTWTAATTITTSPVELCNINLSTQIGSTNYSGPLSVRRTVTDCGGSHSYVAKIPVQTNNAGVVNSVDNNVCYLLESVPTITNLGNINYGTQASPDLKPYNVNLTTGVANVTITNSIANPTPANVVAGECARIVIELYNPVTNVLVTRETINGVVGAPASTWTSTLPLSQSVLNHIPGASILSDVGATTWSFDKEQWSIDNGYTGVNLGVEIRLKSYVGGSCSANSTPLYPVESSNLNNEATIYKVRFVEGSAFNWNVTPTTNNTGGCITNPNDLVIDIHMSTSYYMYPPTSETVTFDNTSTTNWIPYRCVGSNIQSQNGSGYTIPPNAGGQFYYEGVMAPTVKIPNMVNIIKTNNYFLSDTENIESSHLGDSKTYTALAGGWNSTTNRITSLLQLYKEGGVAGHDTNAYSQYSVNGNLPYLSGIQVPIAATPADNSVYQTYSLLYQMKDEGRYERYTYWKPNTTSDNFASALSTHILASY